MFANNSKVLAECNATINKYLAEGYHHTFVENINGTTQTYPMFNAKAKRLVVVSIKDGYVDVPILYRHSDGTSSSYERSIKAMSVMVHHLDNWNEFKPFSRWVTEMEQDSRVDFVMVGKNKGLYLPLNQDSIDLLQKRIDKEHQYVKYEMKQGKFITLNYRGGKSYSINPTNLSDKVLQHIRKFHGFKNCKEYYVDVDMANPKPYYNVFAKRINGTFQLLYTLRFDNKRG